MIVKMIYQTELVDEPRGNRFKDLPEDLLDFLQTNEGSMQGIVERLVPGEYEIIVGIKRRKS